MVDEDDDYENEEKVTFEYDELFQKKILSCMIQDVEFLAGTAVDLIKAEYFETKVMRKICEVIFEYHAVYNDTPTLSIFSNKFGDMLRNRELNDREFNQCGELVKDLMTMSLEEEQYIKDEITDFARNQACREAFIEAATIYETGTGLERIPLVFERAVLTGTIHEKGLNMSIFQDIPAMMRHSFAPGKLISTGIQGLDRLIRGGMAPGELHIYMGRPGVGKSTALLNSAAANLIMGKRVFYATMELKELDIMVKLAQRLSGFTYDELLDPSNNDRYMAVVAKLQRFKPQFETKYWTNQTISVNQVRHYLAKLKFTTGFEPDLILMDYADKLLPASGKRSDSMYQNGGAVYSDLVGLADSLGCPILSASQTQRHAYFLPVIELDNLAESAMKADIAYSIITICQTRDEEKKDQARLYTAKVRNGVTGEMVYMGWDKKRCLISEATNTWEFE